MYTYMKTKCVMFILAVMGVWYISLSTAAPSPIPTQHQPSETPTQPPTQSPTTGPTASSGSSAGAIAGGVIGGLIFILFIMHPHHDHHIYDCIWQRSKCDYCYIVAHVQYTYMYFHTVYLRFRALVCLGA